MVYVNYEEKKTGGSRRVSASKLSNFIEGNQRVLERLQDSIIEVLQEYEKWHDAERAKETCEWRRMGDKMLDTPFPTETSCGINCVGKTFAMQFCPYCSRRIEEVKDERK